MNENQTEHPQHDVITSKDNFLGIDLISAEVILIRVN